MKKLTIALAILFGNIFLFSCTHDEMAEDEYQYDIQATEGEDGETNEDPDDPDAP